MIVSAEVSNAYIDRLRVARNPSEHTLLAYASDLRHYRAFLRAQEIDGVSGDSILSYVGHLTRSGAAARTVRRRVACLRGFYRDLAREKLVDASPFSGAGAAASQGSLITPGHLAKGYQDPRLCGVAPMPRPSQRAEHPAVPSGPSHSHLHRYSGGRTGGAT